jgi:hypothetical protein
MSKYYSMEDVGLLEMWENGERRVVCPFCNGGDSNEKCMSLWGVDDGGVFATCHRDKCSVATIVVRQAGPSDREQPPPKQQHKAMPALQYGNLRKDLFAWMRKKYRFPFEPPQVQPYVKSLYGRSALVFLMYGPLGGQEGIVVKPTYPGEGPKSLTYKDRDNYSGMSWYNGSGTAAGHRIYVVEDPVSALAMNQYTGNVCVSLNGTLLSRDRLDEMLRYKWQIVLMLDADATSTALRYARMYGPDVIRVVRLEKDIKDSTYEELDELFERENLHV